MPTAEPGSLCLVQRNHPPSGGLAVAAPQHKSSHKCGGFPSRDIFHSLLLFFLFGSFFLGPLYFLFFIF